MNKKDGNKTISDIGLMMFSGIMNYPDITPESPFKIELTQGKYTIVDYKDYKWLINWKWYAHKKSVKNGDDLFYATRTGQKGETSTVKMHREIIKRILIEENDIRMLEKFINNPRKFPVDHKDGDGLVNRRCNLRIVSHRENMQNLTKTVGSSQYPGVYWHKEKQKWHVMFKIGNKNHHIGYFVFEDEAYDAYLEAISNLD